MRQWRLGHGAVFLVMLLLGTVIAALATSNGCELMQTFAVKSPANTSPQAAGE